MLVNGGEELGSGRFVLLHDPAGNTAWQGTFRCVTFARADIDPEMVTDPLAAQRRLVVADRCCWKKRRRLRSAERHRDVGLQRLVWRNGVRAVASGDRDPCLVDSAAPRRGDLAPALTWLDGLNYSVR